MHPFRTLMLTVGLTALAHPALAQSAKLFDVTITNVTRAQSFTPFLVTTHAPEISLFLAGAPASPELEILAELVVEIGVFGIGLQRQVEQTLVAAGLGRLVRIEIAFVADDRRQAPAWQRAFGLLVDPASI